MNVLERFLTTKGPYKQSCLKFYVKFNGIGETFANIASVNKLPHM